MADRVRDYSGLRVTPERIEEERSLGWVNFHPEDFCHRCGRPNISWYVDSEEWELMDDVASILCPQCFVTVWSYKTGFSGSWELRLDPLTDKRVPIVEEV